MAVDVDKLLNYNENIYTFTCAAIKRSLYITELRLWYRNTDMVNENPRVFSNREKVVSVALEEVLGGEITYHVEE